jgi:uncharacterized protein YqgV (UPF0045/DUF77 family)
MNPFSSRMLKVVTTLTIDERRDKGENIEQKVRAVSSRLE